MNTRQKRRRLWKESLFKGRKNVWCHYCQCRLTPETITVDHLVPLSKGGLDHPDNFVSACDSCNNIKGSRPARFVRTTMSDHNLRLLREVKRIRQEYQHGRS